MDTFTFMLCPTYGTSKWLWIRWSGSTQRAALQKESVKNPDTVAQLIYLHIILCSFLWGSSSACIVGKLMLASHAMDGRTEINECWGRAGRTTPSYTQTHKDCSLTLPVWTGAWLTWVCACVLDGWQNIISCLEKGFKKQLAVRRLILDDHTVCSVFALRMGNEGYHIQKTLSWHDSGHKVFVCKKRIWMGTEANRQRFFLVGGLYCSRRCSSRRCPSKFV